MFSVEINFDEASDAWRMNKVPIDNGNFKYVCGALTKRGARCKNSPGCKRMNGRCHIHKKLKLKLIMD